jgi:hypothetical protein
MARVAHAVTPAVSKAVSLQFGSEVVSAFMSQLTLVPKNDVAYAGWSIEKEAIGETWHDSSWMLRKGLEVIEDLDLDPPPRAWDEAWRPARQPELGFPALRLAELG